MQQLIDTDVFLRLTDRGKRAILASLLGDGSQLVDRIFQSAATVTNSFSQVLQALHCRTGRGDKGR